MKFVHFPDGNGHLVAFYYYGPSTNVSSSSSMLISENQNLIEFLASHVNLTSIHSFSYYVYGSAVSVPALDFGGPQTIMILMNDRMFG